MSDTQLRKRIAELEAALLPFATYAKARIAMPVNSLGDSVHTIHGGTEWQGEITFSHCKHALAVLEPPKPEAAAAPTGGQIRLSAGDRKLLMRMLEGPYDISGNTLASVRRAAEEMCARLVAHGLIVECVDDGLEGVFELTDAGRAKVQRSAA